MTKERDRLVERAARAMCDKLAVVNGDDCWDIASPRMREDFLVGARAAIAEIEKDHVRVWTCENCAFSFDAIHTNADGSYSCPVCEVTKLEAEAAAKKLGAAPPPDAGQRVLDVVKALNKKDGAWLQPPEGGTPRFSSDSPHYGIVAVGFKEETDALTLQKALAAMGG